MGGADRRRIRLRDLHMLLTVVQGGSMNEGRQRLAVSQPAVSKAIADLEHTLGIRLLDRGPRGVHPTPYCTAFDAARPGRIR